MKDFASNMTTIQKLRVVRAEYNSIKDILNQLNTVRKAEVAEYRKAQAAEKSKQEKATEGNTERKAQAEIRRIARIEKLQAQLDKLTRKAAKNTANSTANNIQTETTEKKTKPGTVTVVSMA